MHSWTRSLAMVFLGLLVVSHLEPSAVIAANSPPKRMRILHGDTSANIPHLLGVALPIYDWDGLPRWSISASQSSASTNVKMQPLTFWEHYKWLIIIVLTVCLLEAALIDVLLRERRRRRMTQKKLEERLRFEQLVSELSGTFINLAPETVEAWIIEALGQVASLLRFDIAALSVFTGRGTEGRVAYIWRAEGIPDIPSNLTDKDFPWSAPRIVRWSRRLSTNSGRAPTGSLH